MPCLAFFSEICYCLRGCFCVQLFCLVVTCHPHHPGQDTGEWACQSLEIICPTGLSYIPADFLDEMSLFTFLVNACSHSLYFTSPGDLPIGGLTVGVSTPYRRTVAPPPWCASTWRAHDHTSKLGDPASATAALG